MMDPTERDDRVMTLAAEALSRPPGERDSFLQVACQNDPVLYGEVTEVVTWEERMRTFLRRPLIEFIDLEGLEKPFAPGQTVSGRFEIIRCVGDGGMGVVYEAFDSKRKQRIAIKCAKPGFGRLLSPELEGALRVRHPNICMVNEIHTTTTDLGDLDFLTMEFLDGETLSSRLARGKLDEPEALSIARQLCAGLAEAHRSNILHRDLKPSNVILCSRKDGSTRAVITDFGLATESIGPSEFIGGTSSYMAPELRQKGQASAASDVYALGVILYEMVTGQKPFPEAAASNGDEAPTPAAPGKLLKHSPRVWRDAILPCLASLPEKRPSPEQILAILDRKPLYLRPWVTIAALVLLVAGAVLWPEIKALFIPPNVRLAILPVQAPEDLAQLGGGILGDVAERVKGLQRKAASISVMPPSDVRAENVSTPEQAGNLLHATHALQLTLSRQGTDLVVEQSLVELAHQTKVGIFSEHYSPQMVGDIPAALTGAISSALHLPRPERSDVIAASAAAAYDRGMYYLSRDYYSYDEAMDNFQTAVQQDPHSPLPLAGLAEAQLAKFEASKERKWLEEARQSLQKAEALNRDSVRVLLAAGRLSLVEGNYPAAKKYYERIEETEPRNVDALLGLAFALNGEGEVENAIKSYRQAIDLDRQLYSSYEAFGAFYFSRGRYAESEEQFRKGIELAPGRPAAYGNLGGVLLNEHKYPEAVAALQTSLKIKENPQSLNNLGAAYASLKQDDLAALNYRRAAKLQPGNILYWVNLGDSERRLGSVSDAKSAYQEGQRLALAKLKVNPQDGQTRAFLAYFRARLGDKAGARNDAGWALSSRPGDNQVIRYAVLTYAAQADWDDAYHTLELGTAKLIEELEGHPDLAEFSKTLRFIEVSDKKHKGE